MNRIDRKKREEGLALVALLVIMLVLAVIAYAFVNIVSFHRMGAVESYNSLKAFYITEGALEIGKKYVSDHGGTAPGWAPVTELFTNEPLGDGTFDLAIHWESGSTFVEFTATAEVD